MAKTKKSAAEMESLLSEQVGFLIKSCAAFDAGDLSEAKRLAVTTRVLVHDTTKSTSLLMLMGRKGIPYLCTSAEYSEGIYGPWTGLLGLNLNDQGSQYLPHYDEAPHGPAHKKWLDWWHTPVIWMPVGGADLTKPRNGKLLQRKDVVLTLSNQVGGAHVDEDTDEAFALIASTPGLGMETMRIHEGGPTPLRNAEKAELYTMRQIAHELLRSLESAGLVASLKLPIPPKPPGVHFGAFMVGLPNSLPDPIRKAVEATSKSGT